LNAGHGLSPGWFSGRCLPYVAGCSSAFSVWYCSYAAGCSAASASCSSYCGGCRTSAVAQYGLLCQLFVNTPPVAPPPPPPTAVVAPEYWGTDANTVFVETLTDASRTSLRWEQEQLENTVIISATGQGVRTIFHDGK